ncbi:hypothetical protein BSNK01_28730 [Bacillaceae bacterium]
MGIFGSLFGGKKKLIENNKEVYEKFLNKYSQNPRHDYLRQLTIEAGEQYYASLRKDGKLTPEDEEAIRKDLKKAEEKFATIQRMRHDIAQGRFLQ